MAKDVDGPGNRVTEADRQAPPPGDPDRFLAWVRDASRPPSAPEDDATTWERLVHDAFAYAERGFQHVAGQSSTAEIACRPGCGWCCYLPVTTTLPEAATAWRYAHAHLGPDELQHVRARAGELPGPLPEPCPFLVEDRCSVYPARPLVCRAWNSTDVSACRRAHALGYESVVVPVHTVARGVFANAAEALARGIAERGGKPPVTLRIALESFFREAGIPDIRQPAPQVTSRTAGGGNRRRSARRSR